MTTWPPADLPPEPLSRRFVVARLVAEIAGLVLLGVVLSQGVPMIAALAATPSPAPVSGVTRPEQGSAPQPMPAVALDAARDSGNTGLPVAAAPSMPAHTAIGTPLIGGTATWYRASGMIAAAGPALREALGPGWRGTEITVRGNGRAVRVRITDWCACGHGHLVDLSDDAFRQLAPLSRGVLAVSIEIHVALPPTDTE